MKGYEQFAIPIASELFILALKSPGVKSQCL